jgi:t-SNARE complex subunit (syntaxin)
LLNLKQEQLQMNRANKQLLNEREKEINHIVKSIQDLNELFKDLATMVVEQVIELFMNQNEHNVQIKIKFIDTITHFY